MEEEVQTFVLDGDLAEAYRQLRDHTAGADLISFVDNMADEAIDALSALTDESLLYRAQGYLAAARVIQGRFQEADRIREENFQKLTPGGGDN